MWFDFTFHVRSLLACVPVTHATPGTPGAAGRCATAAEATRPAARGIGQGRPDAPARPRLYRRPDQIRPILLDDAIAAGGGARHGQCILLRTWGVYKLSATAWGRRISLLGTSQFSLIQTQFPLLPRGECPACGACA